MWPPVPWARTGGRRWSPHFALQAACADGTLYMLTVPGLQLLSRVSVFPNQPASLFCSPDCQWVFALAQDSDLSPKVSARLCPLSQGQALCAQVVGSVPGLAHASGRAASRTGPRLRPLRAPSWAVVVPASPRSCCSLQTAVLPTGRKGFVAWLERTEF